MNLKGHPGQQSNYQLKLYNPLIYLRSPDHIFEGIEKWFWLEGWFRRIGAECEKKIA